MDKNKYFDANELISCNETEIRSKERGIEFAYAFDCDIFVPLRKQI